MEAVKVRVQTQPGFARGLADGMPKFLRSEGYSGYDTVTKNLSFCDYLVIFRARYKLPNVYLMNECSMLSGYIKGLFLFGDVRFHVSQNKFSKRICLFKVKNVADDQNWYVSCRYNDEICVLWDYCGATIQECHPNTKRPVQQKFAAWSQLCWRIRCWYTLCYCLTPCWQPGVFPQQCQGGDCWWCKWILVSPSCFWLMHKRFCSHILSAFVHLQCFVMVSSIAGCQAARFMGSLYPRPSSPNCHDRNTYRSTMGYLWCI